MRRSATLLVAFFLLTTSAVAQSGKLSGRVTDAVTGEALPGVNVVLFEKWANGEPAPVPALIGNVTNVEGYYVILNVPPGVYNVRASFIGYADFVKTQVEVNAGLTTPLDFAMREAVVAGETVEVVAERDVVQVDVSATVEIIRPEQLVQAPVQRVDEFIGKLKGVQLTDTNEGHGLSIRGGSIRETDVRMDGVSLRDPRSESPYLSLNSATIEEIQVKTGGFEAKYGGIQSGLVNVVTKEGSRDRFSVTISSEVAPAGQRRFFGENPWGTSSPYWQVFGGPYAMNGVPDSVIEAGGIPNEDWLTGFRGWSNRRTGGTDLAGLSAEQKLTIWQLTHPTLEVADEPDVFIESALTGPFFLPATTFLLGVKYEDTQFAFPFGPRDSYEDWNVLLKTTTRFSPTTKLSVTGMYANVASINEGRDSQYGGALTSRVNRFNFLSNTSSSIVRQAGLIGGTDGFENLWNRGRFQYYDRRLALGGAKLTHTLSPRSFFTVEGQFSYTDNLVRPYYFDADIDLMNAPWTPYENGVDVLGDPAASPYFRVQRTGGDYAYFPNLAFLGPPNGQATPIQDPLRHFVLSGGATAADSSRYWSANLRADYTVQVGRHHEIEAGGALQYDHIFVYSGLNRSNTFAYEPGFFQYYTATPLEVAAYVQDKLEYNGLVATVGLRAEYFHPMRNAYELSHPLDENFKLFFDEVYGNLPGDINSYQRWVEFREMLASPPGWPEKSVKGQFRLSPRIGASFPITTASKLYFNYGHFYQRPPISFLYTQTVTSGEISLPTPDLKLEKTTSVEFGYEQSLFNNYVLHGTFYYKDVANRALPQTWISYYNDIFINTYVADGYRDIRGVEFRIEKNFGKFFTFWANYDYQVISSGQSGLSRVYEDQLKADLQQRNANISRSQPRPRAYASVNLRTPLRWGWKAFGLYPFGGWSLNPLYEWREGGYIILNPDELNPDNQQRLDVVDYTNLDLRASKSFDIPAGELEFTLSIFNVLNTKRLSTGNMLPAQYEAYRNSLRHPYKGEGQQGDDRWGDYEADHIDIGWYTAPLFLNPRRYVVGMRLRF